MLVRIFLVVVLASCFAMAAEEIMLCKPLNAVFTQTKNGEQIITTKPSRPRPSPGPRGRPGPKGKPGALKEKIIDEKINSQLLKLEERVARLEALTSREVKQDHDKTVQRPCPVQHRDKCYEFVEADAGLIRLDEAEEKCKQLRGELANVYDGTHQRKIAMYARELMDANDDMMYFITGMHYDDEGVVLRGGKRASFATWYSSTYPVNRPGLTQIHVQVDKDQSVRSGMYNTSPLSAATSALCEMPKRLYD